MGLSLNEHIWWLFSPRLLSEHISGQQYTNVTQSAARDWLAPKHLHPPLYTVQNVPVYAFNMPTQCLTVINESVRGRLHHDFSCTCGSQNFKIAGGQLFCKEITSYPILVHLIKSVESTCVASGKIFPRLKKT